MTKPTLPLKSIKSSTLSRGWALARVSVQAGVRATTHVVGGLLASPDDQGERLKRLLTSQMELLARELGELKGSLMKVGQMLSMYGEHVLPPEVNTVLKSLQSQSPPLEWPAIERVLARQLGEKLALLDIEKAPIGAASLGQVHRATIKSDGTQLAMKIQYPGIDKAIDSDLTALKRILSLSKLLPRSAGKHSTDDVFKEVRQMLHQEVDYVQEQEATERFRQALASAPRYAVPRTFPEFSTKRVLSTEYFASLPIDSPEVKGLSQERRDALGAALLELYFKEFLELNAVQTDPHFGNYRVILRPEGTLQPDRLVLLDFGAVRSFSKCFREPYLEMYAGAFHHDAARVVRGAEGLGFLAPTDSDEARRLFAEITFMFMEPLSSDAPYDWGSGDLPKRIAKAGAQLAVTLRLRVPPREVIFLDRKMGGIFIFLSTLGVRTCAREILAGYLERAVLAD